MVDESPSKPRWRASLAIREAVLIVVSVLIALGLESAWQDRGDRVAERDLLGRLRADFAENSRSLDQWQALHVRIVVSSQEFMNLIDGMPEGRRVSVPDSILGDMARTPTYTPTLNSFDAAVSSGQISLIGSVDIQRALARWTRLLEDAQEEEERSASWVYTQILPHLSREADMRPAVTALTEHVRRLMVGLPAEPWSPSSSDVTTSEELTNLLSIRYRLAGAAANELAILQEGLRDVLTLLEQESR